MSEEQTEPIAPLDEQALPELVDEATQLRDQLVRTAADYANYRRRMEVQLAEARAAAGSQLMAQMLDVLDDLDRAREHCDHHQQLVEGVNLVRARMASALTSHGLEAIEDAGSFDPHVHEAVLTQPADDSFPAGQVVKVLRPGWRTADRVIRYAQVVVSV